MKNKFDLFSYIKDIKKGNTKLVNLDKMSSEKDVLSALSKHAVKLIKACFKSEVSPIRLTIFKQFVQHIWKMKKCHGSKHVVQYLKGSHLAIQKFAAGEPVNSLKELLGPGVYPRLASGLPKFIPLADRSMMRNKTPSIFRFYMTLFSLYRILDCPKQLKLSTITKPFDGSLEFLNSLENDIINIVNKHFTEIKTSYKPSDSFQFLETSSYPGKEKVSWLEMRKAAISMKQSLLSNSFDLLKEFAFGPILKALYDLNTSLPIESRGVSGALCSKDEPAGKVRIFAMVDIWTQNVLKPLHDSLFTFLKTLPCDGTFDQWSSVSRGVEKSALSRVSYGYDLSAATDRLPIALQILILNTLFGFKFGDAWASLLVDREYELRDPKYGDHTVKYAVGQPMGALSSWAMLAITHHLIVQLAYQRSYKKDDWFSNYELLGDDIVIFDTLVAEQYLFIMKNIGLEINLSKSVCSPTGEVVEFAKKTYLNGNNISGLPWKAVISQTDVLGIASLIYSLHSHLDYARNIRWVKNWIFGKNLNLLYLSLLKIFTNHSGIDSFKIFDKIHQKYGKIRLKTLSSIPSESFTSLLDPFLKGNNKDVFLKDFEESHASSMFRMMNSKSITLLKSRDVEKDSENLTKFILFHLYPEFNNDYYINNLNIELASKDYSLCSNLYIALYMIINKKLLNLKDSLKTKKLSDDLDTLIDDVSIADRYFEFLEILSRASDKIEKIPFKQITTLKATSFIKQINKSQFSFFSK